MERSEERKGIEEKERKRRRGKKAERREGGGMWKFRNINRFRTSL